jgi:ParB family chromosome partitioning protein
VTAPHSRRRSRVRTQPSFAWARIPGRCRTWITNSKDLRKRRQILPDPVARENFLSEEGDLETASLRIGPNKTQKRGLSGELDAAVDAMKGVPWTTLAEFKGDPEILRKIEDAEALLKTLRKTLSS